MPTIHLVLGYEIETGKIKSSCMYLSWFNTQLSVRMFMKLG